MEKIGSYRSARALPVLTLAVATLLASCGGSSDAGRATAQSAGTSAGCPQVGMQCSGDSTSTLNLGAAEFANYFSGIASNTTISGGASGRFYGAVGAGSSGTGPAEIAGIFQLQGVGIGPVSIGGVLLKRM